MRTLLLCALLIVGGACNKSEIDGSRATLSPNVSAAELSTDKARYNPGEPVEFSFEGDKASGLKVRYKYLNDVVEEVPLSGSKWTWNPPQEDFKGYLAELVHGEDEEAQIIATVAIDVSSSWSKFPRYGFLSKFPQLDDEAMEIVIQNLNRHHINGIQFYDWHYKHHRPLAGTVASPAESWKDIINRDNFRSTIQGYITKAHKRNMNAMFYNLIYGALNTAEADGVSAEWYMYKSPVRDGIDKYVLPKPPFASDIMFTDPSNTAWQDYLNGETAKVYGAYGFDGYHMDQVGNRDKTLYTYSGEVINLPGTFRPFIESAKKSAPAKAVVMNAVNQYGQQGIAASPVDFLYSEVWQPNDTYNALAQIIKDNNRLSDYSKNTVLAAYVNYALADGPGYFNTPSVLFADAVIFAFGGAHIELGEHMLGKEYFPNSNLQMKEDLKQSLVSYYDFLVAYQNLLRDGGTFNQAEVKSLDGKMAFRPWPMQAGAVAVIGKEVDDRQVLHLINFAKATTDQWRDNGGTQADPGFADALRIAITSERPVARVWFASPDLDGGAAKSLSFSQNGSEVTTTVPALRYWDMVVLEF